jgi:hypothetical protein
VAADGGSMLFSVLIMLGEGRGPGHRPRHAHLLHEAKAGTQEVRIPVVEAWIDQL